MTNTPVEAALTGYGRTVSPDASATEAARKLRDAEVSILVVEDGGIEGVVTESDFVTMVAETARDASVRDLMSTPPVAVTPLTPLSVVVGKMRRHDVERVLVVDSEEPRSSGGRPEADTDGTYWGAVTVASVAEHFAGSLDDVRRDGPATAATTSGASVTGD